MLAKIDNEISEAYLRLKELSADDKQRMQYEAREAWLMDQRTREALAHEKGLIEVAKNPLKKGMGVALIAELTGLTKEEIERIEL